MKTKDILLRNEKLTYSVRRSNRARYLRMTLHRSGSLIVTLPRYGSEYMVEPFLRQKADWILKHLQRLEKFQNKIVLHPSQDEYKQKKDAFLQDITKKVEFFNLFYQHVYKKISIRNQTSLWGSCTRTGNIQFNFKLRYLPQSAIDYVVVHELCHLKEHNHGPEFWNLVAKMVPDYKKIRKGLNQYIMKEN